MNLKIEPIFQHMEKHYWKELCYTLFEYMQEVKEPGKGLIEACATLVSEHGFDILNIPIEWEKEVQDEINRRAYENWDGGYDEYA